MCAFLVAVNGIGDDFLEALEALLKDPLRATRRMGEGASTMLPELVDKQQAKAAAGDRFDEAAFDAAAVDGRVPRAVLMQISSWLQALRDGATELDLTGPTLLGGRKPQTWNHVDMRALGSYCHTVARSF